jgi:hypothetical protein
MLSSGIFSLLIHLSQIFGHLWVAEIVYFAHNNQIPKHFSNGSLLVRSSNDGFMGILKEPFFQA